MNTFKTILVAIVLLSGGITMALEQPDYTVLGKVGDVEFRHYDPYLVAEVTVTGPKADNAAFRILAGYIFGDNAANERMNMTAPVETRGRQYAFVMEKKYSKSTLPKPEDPRIRIVERPERVVAVRRFSGRWSEQNFDKHERRLAADLASLQVEVTGEAEIARYNSPMRPAFLRRNEIIVPVDRSSVDEVELVAAEAPARL